MAKGLTTDEWKVERARRQAIADAKQITYKTHEDWRAHRDACTDCKTDICAEMEAILKGMANSENCDMPKAECVRCDKEWEVGDSHEEGQGSMLSCPHCGMVHEVTSVDYTVTFTLTETGKFDPDVLAELEDDDNVS